MKTQPASVRCMFLNAIMRRQNNRFAHAKEQIRRMRSLKRSRAIARRAPLAISAPAAASIAAAASLCSIDRCSAYQQMRMHRMRMLKLKMKTRRQDWAISHQSPIKKEGEIEIR